MHAVLQNETYLDNGAKNQGHLIMFRPSGNHGDEGSKQKTHKGAMVSCPFTFGHALYFTREN